MSIAISTGMFWKVKNGSLKATRSLTVLDDGVNHPWFFMGSAI
jgi:hypothetical protein